MISSTLLPLLATLALAAPAPAATSAASSNSTGCGKALPSGISKGSPSNKMTIQVGDDQREYLVHLPSNYQETTAHPVYFSFHGAGGSDYGQETLSQFSNPDFNHHGISIYPNGDSDAHWLSNPSVSITKSPSDIDFTLEVLQAVEDAYCVDTTRVYAAGKSNGGGLVNLLACNSTSSAKFAAFADVSAANYKNALALNCDPAKKPVPFIIFHGLTDDVIPYYGKNESDDAHSTFQVYPFSQDWAERNGCPHAADPSSQTQLYDDYVTKFTWTCNNATDVVQHYREKDLGHIWPSTEDNSDCEAHSSTCPMGHYVFNATEVIFEFFGNWSLPASA